MLVVLIELRTIEPQKGEMIMDKMDSECESSVRSDILVNKN
jgi:hypothetical protein